jgi:hypothetical protein
MTAAARRVHDRLGRSGGNGSLMRTSPVALAHLDDPKALVTAAGAVSALTHTDPQAGEACALWCLGIRSAVLDAVFPDLRDGLALLPKDSRPFWLGKIEEAGRLEPRRFRPNGYVVTALQAAWSAINLTQVIETRGEEGIGQGHILDALETAIRIGDDTDTVASIAGALLGARWGASAFPSTWRSLVHGWPDATAEDLVDLARWSVGFRSLPE